MVDEYFDGAKKGDIAQIARCLGNGMPIDFQDNYREFGYSALLVAIAHTQPAAVEYLLSQGANVNARGTLRDSSVHLATFNGDLGILDRVLRVPGVDVFALDRRLESAFELAREKGNAQVLSRLNQAFHATNLLGTPEHYLVVNFVGMGGGGNVDGSKLEHLPRIAGVTEVWRNAKQINDVRRKIKEWMRSDRASGGPRDQSIVLVAGSWGSEPANDFAHWFNKEYGRPVRMEILIDGANFLGLPVRRMGPAEIKKAYYVKGFRWPRGAAVGGAENVCFGNIHHNEGLFLGAREAVEDIKKLVAREITVPR
jgi:hypothetical protein